MGGFDQNQFGSPDNDPSQQRGQYLTPWRVGTDIVQSHYVGQVILDSTGTRVIDYPDDVESALALAASSDMDLVEPDFRGLVGVFGLFPRGLFTGDAETISGVEAPVRAASAFEAGYRAAMTPSHDRETHQRQRLERLGERWPGMSRIAQLAVTTGSGQRLSFREIHEERLSGRSTLRSAFTVQPGTPATIEFAQRCRRWVTEPVSFGMLIPVRSVQLATWNGRSARGRTPSPKRVLSFLGDGTIEKVAPVIASFWENDGVPYGRGGDSGEAYGWILADGRWVGLMVRNGHNDAMPPPDPVQLLEILPKFT